MNDIVMSTCHMFPPKRIYITCLQIYHSLQDEYSPIDLFSHAPQSGQRSQTHPNTNDGQDGEVEVLRMVTESFDKYDSLNSDGHEPQATIHEGLGGAMVDDNEGEDGLAANDTEG